MHPMIPTLANYYGVKLSDRIAFDTNRGLPDDYNYDGAQYDGKTIATRVRGFCHEPSRLFDHDLLHEIGHYVAATNEQRDLPEYGLGTVIYGEQLGESFPGNIAIPAVVSKKESVVQEYMAQLLSVVWGQRFEMSADLHGNYENQLSWDMYLSRKTNEAGALRFSHVAYNNNECMWQAMSRLRDMQLLPFNYRGL